MRDGRTWLLVAGCLATLTAACYGRALFRGEQFAYRDAAHYYYPLYQRVQQEWAAGRVPLWEPEENGGMPLLGNPTAAVLYPGKLIFAVVDYPLGARLYVVGHSLLAFAAMVALLRSWGVGATGAGLAGLAYAFGGPILFQYCNIIYLVGAAWAPLGLLAADRWLRLGRRGALIGLAVVLALETLGGEPEVAYLTGLCAGGYAAALAWGRARASGRGREVRGRWKLRLAALACAAALVVVWVAATLAMDRLAPRLRAETESGQPTPPLPWMPWVRPAVAGAWALAGAVLLTRWRRARQAGRRPVLVPMLAGLAGAAALAGALAAVQLLPVLEFTGRSARAAGEGPHDIYPFSLEPVRAVELLWPNVFGTPFHGNRSWQAALPPGDRVAKVWVPTLYLGGLTAALALAALTTRVRGAAPWRAWMGAIAVASLVGSFGEFTSPLWWARLSHAPEVRRAHGEHDTQKESPIRKDRHLRDGDGGAYWMLALVLPGFRQFRFPSKLLTFTTLALAALAGLEWDALSRGDPQARRRTAAWAAGLLLLSLAALVVVATERGALTAWLGRQKVASGFGPLDAQGAVAEMLRSFAQGAGVFAAALVLALWGYRRAGPAAAAALALTVVDLAAANAQYVLTLPQRAFETTPEVLAAIRDAEKEQPAAGPYRVHRIPTWDVIEWSQRASPDRVGDFVRWERDTIQPKYGVPYGVEYTLTIGVAELYDYEWFFGGFYRRVEGELARRLGVADGARVVAFPRRSFDLWNTRYFILPLFPGAWDTEERGYASFLENSERVFPPPDFFDGPGGSERQVDWVRTHDVQVFRNKTSYPRSWVVHEARFMKPILGMTRAERNAPMQEILYSSDMLWNEPGRLVFDPRRLVWAEQEDRARLAPFLTGGAPNLSEGVTVVRHEPDRVELSARLDRPGVVVLADVYYPGWTLTIDGKPAPVLRVNRMMRGAAVPSGTHRLVYTFDPGSYRVGRVLSAGGLVALVLLGLGCWFRPTAPTLAPEATDDSPRDPTNGAS